jgi:hypothetical protein
MSSIYEEVKEMVRFIGNISLGLAGAFLVAASLGFSAGIAAWIVFGIALGIVALLGVAQLDRRRGLVQHALDGLTGSLALWAVVASVIFTGATVTWLSFGEAVGFVTLAVAGLAAHELEKHRALPAVQAAPGAGQPAEELRAVA